VGDFKMPRKVIDEKCTCGHPKSVHMEMAWRPWNPDTEDEDAHPRKVGEGQKRARGHGACSFCICSQFTWKSFVFDDWSEDIVPV